MTETNPTSDRTPQSRRKVWWRHLIAPVVLIVAIALPNTSIAVSHRRIADPRIPEELSGYRLAQVSDLHNREGTVDILNHLMSAAPDLIVITGDLIDSNQPDPAAALAFVEAAAAIAPVAFASGNHEAWSGQYESLKQGLTELGVTTLEDQTLELGGDAGKVLVSGLRDPAVVMGRESTDNTKSVISESLASLPRDPDRFHILLAHRPEFMNDYAQAGVDLVLAGHAHGGQFRLLNIGLYAPGQGFFPKYTSGVYRQGTTRMIVSRGLGNSVIPVRIFNRLELVIIELVHE